MAAFVLIIVCALAALHTAAGLKEIPSFLHICQGDDPELAACIVESTQSLASVLGDGYAPMDLPPLNPFTIKDFVVSPRSSGLLMTVRNLHIYNASNFTVHNLKVIKSGHHYQFDVHFPYFYTNGTYVLQGRLLMLDLEGSGPSWGKYYGITARVSIKMKHTPNADGELSPRVSELKFHVKLKRGIIRLDNLFNGDRVLGDAVNAAINDNFDVFSGELMPLMEERLSEVLTKHANTLLGHFTSAQLFPKVALS